MSKVDRIVQVTILRESRPISQAAFDMVLILGENLELPEDARYAVFSTDDLTALAAVLGETPTTKPEYLAAEALASQSPRPINFAVGRVDSEDADHKEALAAVLLENSNFFYVVCVSRTQADQEAVADWCNSNRRIFISVSAGNDGDILDPNDDTSLPFYIKDEALDKACCIYHADAATDYIDAGLSGLLAVRRPGTYTPMFKTIIGSGVDTLTTTEQGILFAKYCSSYESVGGQNILQEGWVGTGEYLDLIIWLEWLNSKIQSNVYSLLAKSEKIPFTSEGLGLLESAVQQVLEIEQSAKAISPEEFDGDNIQTGGYHTSVPKVSELLPNDKLLRVAKDIKFTCWYNNPIHRVQINGVIKI